MPGTFLRTKNMPINQKDANHLKWFVYSRKELGSRKQGKEARYTV